ncbi:hypothetical protein ACQ5SO_11575 [Rhodovulum sp. DZ06]|uniref:hypothetical protein n=1 Tax=Rhodovulum sp. DZ06 TaxID=3425126 RepID=UPI003D34C315
MISKMRFPAAALCAAVLGALSAQPAAAVVFSGAGPDAASIQGLVDDFRAALGPLNPNAPINADPNGRREINWDGAPAAVADPNLFPGDFFNGDAAPRARGIEFEATGDTTSFMISSAAADNGPDQPAPAAFGFTNGFTPFSPERLFAPVGGTTFDVEFYDPLDQTIHAAVRGFGMVFTDVESDSVLMEFYDFNGALIETLTSPQTGNAGLSFIGLVLDDPQIARVSIDAGTAALLQNGSFGAGDAVVMDDVIFGEPIVFEGARADVPLPAPAALLAAGLFALGLRGRRKG